jgi:hypothetical protein
MIASHEGEHQVLSLGVSHKFQAVFNGLSASDIKMNPPFFFKAPLICKADFFCEKNFFLMEVLAGELRKGIDLGLEYLT